MPIAVRLFCCIIVFSFLACGQTAPVNEFLGPFPSWTNVKTVYGAVGDGGADDTNAFQSALNLIGTTPGLAVLYVPAGTYRITRTLSVINRSYISIVGENPSTTTLKWGGAAGGAILNLNGVVDSRFDRLTFDGNRTAGIAVDQSWDGQGASFDVHNQYADDVFQNSGIGLRCGHLSYGAADSVVLRSQFLGNTVAGISVENWNALNWYIRESYFRDNYVGITNTLGAGNFHVYNSVFIRSSRADVEVTNAEYFSMRHNFSIGSGYFFLGNPIGNAPDPITFQNNVILDPIVQAISIGSAGPVMLLDNTIRSGITPVVSVIEGFSANPVNANVISAGNTFTNKSPYQVSGRLLALDDKTVDPSTIALATPGPAATPASQGRPVFEIPTGAGAATIQQAVNTAVTQKGGQRPIVHLPGGTYYVDQTILIPAGSDLQFTGDGGASVLSWTGADGTVLRTAASALATLANFRIVGGAVAQGVYIDVKDDPGAVVYLDQVDAKVTSVNNLLVEGLKNANVSLSSFYHDLSRTSIKVAGPGSLTGNAPHTGGRVDLFGGGDGVNQITYDISYGGLLVAQDVWYEGPGPGFATLSDSGSFTLSGAAIYTEDPGHGGLGREIPPLVLNDFNGSFSLLNAKIGHGGISLNGAGNNMKVLGLGVNGPAGTPDYFLNQSPNAQAALLYSTVRTPAGGSRQVPDRITNVASSPDFVRQMIAELRAARPLTAGGTSGGPSVRMFRVIVEQSTVGIHIKTADATPGGSGSVTIVSPTTNQTVSGVITIAAQVSTTAAKVQFSVDGIAIGVPSTTAPFGVVFDTTTVANGTHVLLATATDSSGASVASLPVSVNVQNNTSSLPGSPLVTGFTTATLRNNFSGWVGMQFTVGPDPLAVVALARQLVAGNTASHAIKLVRASDGADVPGGSVSILLNGAPGQFSYGRLPNPVTLSANTSYYLVSNETQGGDQWYDYTPVTSTSAARIVSPVYWNGSTWISIGVDANSFGPVNLLYTASSGTVPPVVAINSPTPGATLSGAGVTLSATASASGARTIVRVQFAIDGANFGPAATTAPYTTALDTSALNKGSHTVTAVATDSAGDTGTSAPVAFIVNNNSGPAVGSPLIVDFVRGGTRNNFTGPVGMKITTGSVSIDVTALGRIYLPGNTATHAVKLVRVSDGSDVPGAQVTVAPSGAAGQFSYVSLANPVTLAPNSSYYVVSRETSGGDSWYEYTPVTATTSAGAANVDGPVYFDGSNFVVPDAPGSAYVPVNLLYVVTGSVPASNRKPVANPQSLLVLPGVVKTIALTGSDAETAPANLTFALIQQPAHGTLTGSAPNLTFTPVGGYLGPDSFQFKVTDRGAPDNCGAPNPPKCWPALDSDPATVSIVISPPNSAPVAAAQTAGTAMGTPKALTLAGSDAETASANLSFTITQQPARGTLTGNPPNITYTPNVNYAGPDSFQFTVTDRGTPDNCTPGPACGAALTSQPAVVTINITALNSPPTATPQTVGAVMSSAKAIALAGTDVETPAANLSFTITANPTHGSLTGSAPNLTYTPVAGYVGPDSFQFTATDRGAPDNCGSTGPLCAAALSSAAATVTIAIAPVNIAPTANSQSFVTPRNTPKQVVLTGSDAETPAASLSFTITSNPAHGTLSGSAPNFTYTPTSNYVGPDSFQFKVTDRGAPDNCVAPGPPPCAPALDSAPATVTIAISPVNTAPNANAQAVKANLNTAVAIGLSASDAETSAGNLTYTIAANPTHGTLTGTAPNLIYTPVKDYQGPDSFDFTVTDRGAPDNCGAPSPVCAAVLNSSPATVTISVALFNTPPVATPQTVVAYQSSVTPITLTGTDAETAPENLTFTITAYPSHGTLFGTAPNLAYRPDAYYTGPDSFQFTATDRGSPDNCRVSTGPCVGPLDSVPATITLTVAPAK